MTVLCIQEISNISMEILIKVVNWQNYISVTQNGAWHLTNAQLIFSEWMNEFSDTGIFCSLCTLVFNLCIGALSHVSSFQPDIPITIFQPPAVFARYPSYQYPVNLLFQTYLETVIPHTLKISLIIPNLRVIGEVLLVLKDNFDGSPVLSPVWFMVMSRKPVFLVWKTRSSWEIKMAWIEVTATDGPHHHIFLNGCHLSSQLGNSCWLQRFSGLLTSYLAESFYLEVTSLQRAQIPGDKKGFCLTDGPWHVW